MPQVVRASDRDARGSRRRKEDALAPVSPVVVRGDPAVRPRTRSRRPRRMANSRHIARSSASAPTRRTARSRSFFVALIARPATARSIKSEPDRTWDQRKARASQAGALHMPTSRQDRVSDASRVRSSPGFSRSHTVQEPPRSADAAASASAHPAPGSHRSTPEARQTGKRRKQSRAPSPPWPRPHRPLRGLAGTHRLDPE